MTPDDDSKNIQHGSPQGSVQDAVARLFDGDLSEEKFAELTHRLENDAEARREYFDCVSLEATLETVFYPPLSRNRQRSLRHAGKSAPPSVIRKTIRWSAGIAAVAAAIALSVMYFTPTEPPSTETRLRVCGNSQWSVNGTANPKTSTLPQGVEFQLHQGVAELKLPYDVTAIVEAPATITLIDDRTLRLDQGKALFQVPTEKGKGFTVVTPHQRIVDLGTKFGIRFSNKHPDQLELHVLQGEVRIDALENDSNSPDQGAIIQKGRAVLLAGTRVLRELDNTQTTFRRKLPEKVDILFQDDFESGLLPEKEYAVRIEPYAVRNASGKRFPGIADDTSWHFTTPPIAHEIFAVGFETPNIKKTAVTAIAPGWSEGGRKGASGLYTSALSTEGRQHAWLNGPATNGPTTSHITLDQPITAGTTYILTADVGQTANFHGSQGTLSLYGSDKGFSSPLATTTASPPRGGWLREQSVSFTATSDIATGQRLGIAQSCTGGPQAIFDNLHVYSISPASTPQLATLTPSLTEPNTPPDITDLSPATGTTTGSPDGKLRLKFNQPIETKAGRFIVKNLTNDTESMIPVKDRRVKVTGNTITINPPTELADGQRHMGRLNGWQTNAWVGIFNPKGTGTRYHHEDLWDNPRSPGTIGAMEGPTMATFDSTPPNAHIRRQLGTITPHSRYTVSLAIGVRSDSATTPANFDGYTIRLTSGDTTLATLSNDTPPGPANSVTTVSFSWDSSDMLSNVPLTLEISPNNASGPTPGYLDIDAVRVSVLSQTSK
ncbi:MAG TPA: hypothetical protein DHV60_09745 [Verrucomicrobiales bacterium]|nr:hypothetical protein [Verrucomicrobiales bacterium]